MTAKELIDDLLFLGPQDLNVILSYIADHASEARLAGGERLNDVTDFKAFLRELGEAWRVHGLLRRTNVAIDSWQSRTAMHDTCPRCGHVHQGEAECGELLGGGRVCRCELSVPA